MPPKVVRDRPLTGASPAPSSRSPNGCLGLRARIPQGGARTSGFRYPGGALSATAVFVEIDVAKVTIDADTLAFFGEHLLTRRRQLVEMLTAEKNRPGQARPGFAAALGSTSAGWSGNWTASRGTSRRRFRRASCGERRTTCCKARPALVRCSVAPCSARSGTRRPVAQGDHRPRGRRIVRAG